MIQPRNKESVPPLSQANKKIEKNERKPCADRQKGPHSEVCPIQKSRCNGLQLPDLAAH